ncbi:MAG: hypothetical protein U5L96_16645 [Owenweeksia sp.]|nr:hypothetical protein [Owenweeksia sp.]
MALTEAGEGHPENEGTPAVTNNWVSGEPGSDAAGPNDAKVNNKDGLHFVTGPGYYGGHPNPIRANPTGAGLYTHDHNDGTGGTNGVFRTSYTGVDATTLPYDWPPVDPAMANPIEADYQNPGVDDQSLWTITASSNGMCEYTASNFGNALKGNLLATSWNENIYQINLNAAGSINSSSDVSSLASNFGSDPLDVTAQGDSAIFPGTIWIASYGSNKITILEPQDFAPCNGTDDSGIDEDFDGYSNADEIDNASDPCNGSSLPPDNDKTIIASFKVSDLNDPDDDDDGLLDTVDPYAWDAANGANTTSPLNYTLLNGDPGTGFYGLGFTGLMTNGIDNYTSLIQDEDNSSTEIIAGGAVGLLTFNDQAAGSPVGSQNDLKNAFQFGLAIDDNTAAIRVDVRLLGPLFQGNPQGDQFQGFFIGNGDQDNFLMMTVAANNGTPVVEFTEEMNGLTTTWTESVPGIENASETSLLMVIDPGTGEVQARVDTGTGAFDVGSLLTLSGSLLSTLQGPDALAIGVAAGRSDATPLFNATWDFIKVEWLVNPMGNWSFVHNGNTCAPMGSPGSCPQGRHEASYAQIGDKFILLGGKEHGSNVNIYDPAANSWTVGASPDVNIHHFQAVEYEGLLYMLGAMSGKFPNEQGLPSIWIYDPHNDEWCEGPPMPQNRIRGSAGCVVYNDKLYLVAGIINGHTSGWVPWFDVFDPATNSWTTLPDAPHSRDHFHAAIVNDKLYALAGRRSGSLGTFNDTEADVDVYDFNTGSWSTLPNTLPTERAGNTVAVLGDEILVIGGEKYNGDAEATTEALDVNTNNWRALADMNDGRHGTQAIVNNGGVYIASGSPVRGSGQLLSQEVFSFGTTQSPILNAITPGQITASAGNIKFPVVNGGGQASKTFTISNVGGNQGIIVKDVAFEDGSGLSYSTNPSLPYHLSPGENFDITITYAPAVTGLPDDLMTVLHTGLTPFTQVIISDPSCPSVSLGQDQVICPNEQLSFTAGTFLDSAVWYVNNQVVASGVQYL